MFTPIVTVSVTAVTEEHHFATLDRHGRDTYGTLHYIELVLHTHKLPSTIYRIFLEIYEKLGLNLLESGDAASLDLAS
jgi:hypothetical protein